MINDSVAGELYSRLATEFVKIKVDKLNCWSRFYLYLQQGYVHQVMFVNDYGSLDSTVKEHAKGEIYTPCELEIMMRNEAQGLIKQSFDTVGGQGALVRLLDQAKDRSNILELTSCH